MNKNLIKVYLTFTNKKGIEKTVHFLMDKLTYEDLQKVTKEECEKYMLEEYRWFCKEQKHKRKTQSINSFYDENGELTIEGCYDEKMFLSDDEELVRKMLSLLSSKERNIIILLYYEGYTQEEVSKKLNCSRQLITYIHKKTLKKLKDISFSLK